MSSNLISITESQDSGATQDESVADSAKDSPHLVNDSKSSGDDGDEDTNNSATDKSPDCKVEGKLTKPRTTNWPLKDIKDPHNNDVLYGRGGGTNHHLGNKRYRTMVEDRKLDYVNSKRLDKPLVALEIIRTWRGQDPPGRFLKLDEKTGLWHDVGDKKAREKTSQALREKAPLLRKQQEEGRKEDDADADADSQNEGSSPGTPQRTTRFNIPESEKKKKDNKSLSRAKLARDHSLGRDFLEPNEAVTLDGFSWQEPLTTLKSFDSDDTDSVPPPRSSSILPSSGSRSQKPQQHHPVSPRFQPSRTEGWSNALFPAPGYTNSTSSTTGQVREHSLSMNPLREASISGPARNPFSDDASWGGRQGSSNSMPPPIPYTINGGNGGSYPPGTKPQSSRFLTGETTGSAFSRTNSRSDEFRKKNSMDDGGPVSRASSGWSAGPYPVTEPPQPLQPGKAGYSVQSDDYAKFATMIGDDTYTTVQKSWSGRSSEGHERYNQGARSFSGVSSTSNRGNEYDRSPSKEYDRSSQDEYTVGEAYNRTPPNHYSSPSDRSSSGGGGKHGPSPPKQGYSITYSSEGPGPSYSRFGTGEGYGQKNGDARIGQSRSFDQADNAQRQNRSDPPPTLLPVSLRLPATLTNPSSGVSKPSLRRKISGGGLMPQLGDLYDIANNSNLPRPQPVKRETSNQNESQETKRMVKRAVLGRERSATAKLLRESMFQNPEYELDANVPVESAEDFDDENDVKTLQVSLEQSTLGGKNNPSKFLTPRATENIARSVDGVVSEFARKSDLNFDRAGNKVQRSNTMEKVLTLIDGFNGTKKSRGMYEAERTDTIDRILMETEREHGLSFYAERSTTGDSSFGRVLEKSFGLSRPAPIKAGDRLSTMEAISMTLEDGGPLSRPSPTSGERYGPVDNTDLVPNDDWLED